MNRQPDAKSRHVLVSDFDGTMTRHDFYQLAIESLVPPGTRDYWADYRAGTITHFEALQHYFAAIQGSEADVLDVVRRMEPDPELRSAVESLQQSGWTILVASAGCDWYIRRLLAEAGVALEVHANPGHFASGSGLVMERPGKTRFPSAMLGIDKAAIVRHSLNQGSTVAYAGDGYPDLEPSLLVPDHLRFARGDLAAVLSRQGHSYQPFDVWSEIVPVLLGRSS